MDKESLKAKIMTRVDIDPVTGCWNWRGGFLKSALPIPYVSFNRKTLTVKRELFKIEIGEIFESQIQVRSSCGNNICVCPEHLTLKKGNPEEVKKFHIKKYKTKEQKVTADKRNRRTSWLNKKEREGIPDAKYNFGEWNKKRREMTHCKIGHSLEDAIVTKKGRSCRTCQKEHMRKYRAKKVMSGRK